MLWIVAYDVPVTHDPWRDKVAKHLSGFGFYRLQYSVFFGNVSSNSADGCKKSLEAKLRANSVPCDIRFFPLCLTCESKMLMINVNDYIPNARNLPGVTTPIIIGGPALGSLGPSRSAPGGGGKP